MKLHGIMNNAKQRASAQKGTNTPRRRQFKKYTIQKF